MVIRKKIFITQSYEYKIAGKDNLVIKFVEVNIWVEKVSKAMI